MSDTFKEKFKYKWLVVFESEDPNADWELCSDMDLASIIMDTSRKIRCIMKCEEGD